jgi:hypothetical protein
MRRVPLSGVSLFRICACLSIKVTALPGDDLFKCASVCPIVSPHYTLDAGTLRP